MTVIGAVHSSELLNSLGEYSSQVALRSRNFTLLSVSGMKCQKNCAKKLKKPCKELMV